MMLRSGAARDEERLQQVGNNVSMVKVLDHLLRCMRNVKSMRGLRRLMVGAEALLKPGKTYLCNGGGGRELKI